MSDTSAPRIGPYGAILDIAKAMVAGGSLESTLQSIVENVGRAMFADSASLGSYDSKRDVYVAEAFWRDGGLHRDEAETIGTEYPLSEEPELRKQLQSRSLSEHHIDDPALSPGDREYFTERGIKTSLDCPLVFGGKVIGLLSVEESRFVRRYTPSERDLFMRLCDLAAIGIHTARQARLLEETQRRLDRALMGRAAEGAGMV